jgi:PAS domain S-box-containing protein
MKRDTEHQGPILNIANEGFLAWDLKTDRLCLSLHCCDLPELSSGYTLIDAPFLNKSIHLDDHQNIPDITGRNQDASQLYYLNRALQAISQCNQALLHATNEIDLLNEICRIVVEIGGYRMAWVGYAEDDEEKGVRPVAQAGFEEGYIETLRISWADVERGRGPTGTTIRTGQVCFSRNMSTDPRFEPWRTEARKRGYVSSESLPLISSGKVFGALTIYSDKPDAFNSEETKLLTSLADNMAYGISMLQTRKAHEMAEDELRQSEARYRTLFENRHVVMFIIDPDDGQIVDANPTATLYYGWTRDELCRMKISQINILTPQEVIAEMTLAHSNKCNVFNFRHLLADGSIRDVEVVSGPIVIDGKLLLYSIVIDVTERKRFQELLLEGHEWKKLILKATNAALWEYEFDSGFNIWSDEVWRLYGIEPHSCEPSYENWLNTIIPEDREAVRRSSLEAAKNGSEFNEVWRVRDPDGTVRWLMSKGTPSRDGDGRVSRYVGIVIDITDRKMEEENTRQLESHLRKSQRLETIGTLTGGIAHDFNNILTPILGYAEMGALKLSSEDRLHDYFTTIMHAARRARNLISQILVFSSTQDITPCAVSVQSVIAEVLKLLRPSIPVTVRIEQQIDDSCGAIFADPSQIHQIIVNLCTNAFQEMEKSGGVITIALREIGVDSSMNKLSKEMHAKIANSSKKILATDMHAKRYVELSVSDNGRGMDEATMDRIFEPFFTTKRVNKGTGLGLSVVHRIVTSCKGMIMVDSHPGKGAAFYVYLPVIDEQMPNAPFDE